MRLSENWIRAIAVTSVLIFSCIILGLGGMFLGGMSTDRCISPMPEWTGPYLFVFWPLTMLAGAILPALLIGLGKRWQVALASALGLGSCNCCVYFGWFAILNRFCG